MCAEFYMHDYLLKAFIFYCVMESDLRDRESFNWHRDFKLAHGSNKRILCILSYIKSVKMKKGTLRYAYI